MVTCYRKQDDVEHYRHQAEQEHREHHADDHQQQPRQLGQPRRRVGHVRPVGVPWFAPAATPASLQT